MIKSLPPVKRELITTEPSQIDEPKKEDISLSVLDQRIQIAIYEKTSSFLNSTNLSEQGLK